MPTAVADVSKAHNDKMFQFHAKMLAVAKTKGDVAGTEYHSAKVKHYSGK